MKYSIIYIALIAVFASCKNNTMKNDAAGTFEAVETIVSSEANGNILSLNFEEGQTVKQGELCIQIDSLQLLLKRKQLLAQIKAVLSKRPEVSTQLAALNEQLKHAEKELARVQSLLKADAATQKQVDDADAQVSIYKKQISALQSSLSINSYSINEESIPLNIQIEQINDQISKCNIRHPLNGSILSKYVEAGEFTTIGKPLYKIADLSVLILKAYITADQFNKIKIGQVVKVITDAGDNADKTYQGSITWISSKAEFTPKTIQTKDERANLVYAIKVAVKNDGFLKLGMYGEIKF